MTEQNTFDDIVYMAEQHTPLMPETVLKLVRVVQAAKVLVEGLQRMDFNNVSGACSKCADALEGVES